MNDTPEAAPAVTTQTNETRSTIPRRMAGVFILLLGVALVALIARPLRAELSLQGKEVAVMSGPVTYALHIGPITHLEYAFWVNDVMHEGAIHYRNEPLGAYEKDTLIGIRYVVDNPAANTPDYLRWYKTEMLGAAAVGIFLCIIGAIYALRPSPKPALIPAPQPA